jgi:hypothetical protein
MDLPDFVYWQVVSGFSVLYYKNGIYDCNSIYLDAPNSRLKGVLLVSNTKNSEE